MVIANKRANGQVRGFPVKDTLNRMFGPKDQPIEKLAIMGGSLALANYLVRAMDDKGCLHKVFLACLIFEGLLTNLLGFRMSMFRVQITNDPNTTKSPTFLKWSRVQINNAEWSGLFLSLMLTLHCLTKNSVGIVGAMGAIYTNIGTFSYILGNLVFTGDVELDNPAFGNRLPPFRMSGASMRYVGVFMMLYGIIQEYLAL